MSEVISCALLFAAGRGERMRPLTDHTPKPLLNAGGKPLIEWHLEKLGAAGVRSVVINTSYLADQIAQALGDGARWNLRIVYSYEGPQPLETGGGMQRALAHLDGAAFIAVNSDIWTDLDFTKLLRTPENLAHLVMIDNPAHHPRGDFLLRADGKLEDAKTPARGHAPGSTLTFSGIGVYRPELLRAHEAGRFALAPVLRIAMDEGKISGEHFHGAWTDVGTPERLAELRRRLE